MPQNFEPGDYLVFQLESGFALLRVLEIEDADGDGDTIWHLAAFRDLFLDVDSAERAIQEEALTIEIPHVAITNRAFESTQVARLANRQLDPNELAAVKDRRSDPRRQIHDRSIKLLLGLR